MNVLRTTTAVYAGTRLAYGLGLFAAPERVARRWLGDGLAEDAAKVGVRGLGARDAVIAAGAIAGAAGAWDPRPWLVASAIGDSSDIAATSLADGDRLPSRAKLATAAVAGAYAAAAIGLALAHGRD